MKNTIGMIVVALLSAVLSIAGYKYFEEPQQVIIREEVPARYTNFEGNSSSSTTMTSKGATPPSDFIKGANKATPAVVYIKASSKGSGEYWWGGGGTGSSTGSGVILSEDGYIVTNNHVIEDADNFEVTLNDNRTYDAKIIGTDPSTDLALLKIKDKGALPFLQFADSDQTFIGEWVLAVGNPFNLTSTVTAGIISAKGRNISILNDQYAIETFIQTDAVVNPGNSGGALVNTNGDLVGINTAIITKSGGYEGYSFAVPSNLVKKVINDLKEYGEVQRGFLGVDIGEVSPEMAERLGLSAAEGILISYVRKNTGAEEGGLKKNDVINSINGVQVKSVPELQEQVARFRPGDKIKIGFFREGKQQTASVVLKNMNNSTKIVTSSTKGDQNIAYELGFELTELSASEKRKLRVNGVKVKSIIRGSKIERTNMDPGYIITKVDDKKVSSIEEVLDRINQAEGKVMLEGVYEDYKGNYYYAFAKED